MARFGEVGWNMDNDRNVNIHHPTLSPARVQISRGKQKRKAPHKTAAASSPRRHTRSMTTDAVRKAVFNTPELLENIISYLPPRDILTKILRLSRQCKKAVETSPTVRNKLWMTFCKAPAIQSIGFADEHIQGNPMWGRGARPMYPCNLKLNSALFNKTFYGERSQAIQLRKNPLLSWQKVDKDGASWTFSTISFYCHLKRSLKKTNPAFSSTWRSMHLTDPPITMVTLELQPRLLAVHGPDDVEVHLADNTGITLGLLYDTIFATFEAQCGATAACGNVEHFLASLHFVSTSASLGTSILVRE